ncbi:glycoside hydrolase family 32 protein [Cellulophaga sp. Hel_I_12]|uniref:glycoside hydrolase family 32 protein n=1 Tax=Cellulophaga sp. Hel_I_12 TaxID=1249972 RepID=UPI001E327E3D|nr:glycoside hydrolase family 32 protein [Cellulophaga sp. Hel_I_12]
MAVFFSCNQKKEKNTVEIQSIKNENEESYRPQYHFTPSEKWMNDPNGLVYHKGVYHLFYQYYPDDIVWGPMHWGHATSKDMIYWDRKPIALYPDKNGYIFSGSAVIDFENSSGFGSKENPALVALFTYHNMDGEKAGRTDFQTQGVAYSLDNGETFKVYEGNPVIKNEGMKDFRDPKVFWNEKNKSWTMLLVAGNHLQIWQSKDLIGWKKVSEFGKNQGAHGGVWECPDLFPLKVEGESEEKWVLLISINPGAPNGGSGTQYFVGDFDGTTFTSKQENIKWLDWGTDNYAGITYNNTPNQERIFIGWMSNWSYARDTPTNTWRSAMTIPRNLSLKEINDEYQLINYPIDNFKNLLENAITKTVELKPQAEEAVVYDHFNQTQITFTTKARDFKLNFKNNFGDNLLLEMNGKENTFILNREKSGKVDFQEDFASIQKMPIGHLPKDLIEVKILMDWSSIEIFINKGQYVMTAQLFPNENYSQLNFVNTSEADVIFNEIKLEKVKSIWK